MGKTREIFFRQGVGSGSAEEKGKNGGKMTIHEIIEKEYNDLGMWNKIEEVGVMQAAERVIERLLKRVSEMEGQIMEMSEYRATTERERFRDRLDRMVAALLANPAVAISQEKRELMMGCAVDALAAIDAEVDAAREVAG